MNILLTGANQGIGYYTVLELLEKGHNVTVLDYSIDEIIKTSSEYPESLLVSACDVRDYSSVESTVGESVQKFGLIDIAIHNACICTFDSMEKTDFTVYRDVMETNYFGALNPTKAVIPYMRQAKNGKVIFTSSGVGITGFYNLSPYASSKGAIESLAKCLNLEYADADISFHIFHPPLTKTKSSSPLPVPQEMMADPKTVGTGFAKRINKSGFIICHSAFQQFQTRLCYLFPISMGKLMSSMTKRSAISKP